MNTLSTPETAPAEVSKPWWKYRMMWLVVGGPAIVVVASFFTLYLALHLPDPVCTATASGDTADDDTANAALTCPHRLPRKHISKLG